MDAAADRGSRARPAAAGLASVGARQFRTIIEPFRIKSVEPIRRAPGEREHPGQGAHFNLFLLHGNDVLIDLLTDSGTGAMSSGQWAGIMIGDESYAGRRVVLPVEAVQKSPGFTHVMPTHQGRASDRSSSLIGGQGRRRPEQRPLRYHPGQHRALGAEAINLP